MTLAAEREIDALAGYGRYFELTDAEAALLVLAHFAVATATCAGSARRIRRLLEPFEPTLAAGGLTGDEIEEFAASASAHSRDWHATLVLHGARHDAQRLRLLAISLCTRPLMIGAADIVDSTAHRRMDAVLDLWDVESSSVEIQQMHFDTMQVLSGSYLPAEWQLATTGVGPYARLLATVDATEGRTGQPTVSEIARAVMACRFAFVGPDQVQQARRLRDELGSDLSSYASTSQVLLSEFDPPERFVVNG